MKKLLICLVLCAILTSCTRSFHAWFADYQNDIKQEYIIQDANKRIHNYEWFYSQYEEIKATKQKVQILEGKPEQDGVKMVLASMVAEYNAKSKMTVTREQWKDQDLPYQIEE